MVETLGRRQNNEEFVRIFLQSKVDEWREEVEIDASQHHTDPATSCHGVV